MPPTDSTPHVLVVDDEQAVRDALSRALRLHDYAVWTAQDALAALATIRQHDIDCVILDVMMPGIDGTGLARRLRQDGNDVPILMVTARDEVPDRVAGLDAGADDYLPKPFALDELLARLRALLRRSPAAPGTHSADVSVVGDLRMDHDRVLATRGDRTLDLTPTEWELLAAFMDNPGRVLSRQLLSERVWGSDVQSSNTVEVYVGYLRRKLEADGEPRVLHTVRGFGYRLDTP